MLYMCTGTGGNRQSEHIAGNHARHDCGVFPVVRDIFIEHSLATRRGVEFDLILDFRPICFYLAFHSEIPGNLCLGHDLMHA